SGASWDTLRRVLGPARRVVTIDLPGHGESSAPADPARCALPRFADDLIAVLDALQLDRVALLGYSLGGRAALRVALAHPDRLRALVLESGSAGIADPEERSARAHADSELAARVEREGVEAFIRRWERLSLWDTQASLSEAVLARQRAVRLANTAAGLAASLRGAGAAAEPDAAPRLRGLRVPTLLVAGGLDPKYAGIARAMATALPQARLEIVEDAGHAVHLERPERFASLVAGFLDSFDS
ncbi:MAG: 2-succinyl-6-hydroxy-2,4-cyclohexadiene-1-carboxylate synthase, partial [Gemmatimonadaceae bacterium]|nr:2-succinyl-6-hydroxy-2,4-cyclohexadiene-1-carboxylate synthase [Gemmatimonadaceae bacterium]